MSDTMSKAALESALRNELLEKVADVLSKNYDTDVLAVSASELAIPLLDKEGNEKFALIKISIPRGSRNGEGGYTAYDGYAAAEDYKLDLADRAAKRAASAEKKAAAERERERKREARKVVKELNSKGLDKMIHAEE